MKIFAAITNVMKEVGHIGKDRKNSQQGYNFRGVDDAYAALQLVMAKHGVFTAPEVLEERSEERTTPKGTVLIYRVLKIKFRFYADDGSYFDVATVGEGMDAGDKASNKAMSVAHKYALLQVFMIPTTEAKDPENDSHEVVRRLGLGERVAAMLKAFSEVSVGEGEIEDFLGKPLKDVGEEDLSKLRPLLLEIREDRAKKSAERL